MTVRALGVGAVAAEQHADVHFVTLRFEPIEKTLHSIPKSVFPEIFPGRPRTLPLQHPILIRLGEFLKRAHRVHFARRRAAHEIALAFAPVLRLEGLDHALRDAQSAIRDGAREIDGNRAPETPARGTGSMRVIEAEQSRRRRGDIQIAMRAMPARGERQRFAGPGARRRVASRGRQKGDLAFPKSQGRLHRFGDARAILFADDHAILDHRGHGRQPLHGHAARVRSPRFAGLGDFKNIYAQPELS